MVAKFITMLEERKHRAQLSIPYFLYKGAGRSMPE